MIWQVVVKSILLCIVWQTNSGLFDVFLSLSQIDGVLRFYALHTRVFHKSLVHSIFRFLVTLTCLFIFCIKHQHFFLKMPADFFHLLVTLTKKTKNEMKQKKPSKKCLATAFKARNGKAAKQHQNKNGLYGIPWSFNWNRFKWKPLTEKWWSECESRQRAPKGSSCHRKLGGS